MISVVDSESSLCLTGAIVVSSRGNTGICVVATAVVKELDGYSVVTGIVKSINPGRIV